MKVIDVERTDGDVIVTFEDGVTVLFSAALLREIMPRAQIFPASDPQIDPDGAD